MKMIIEIPEKTIAHIRSDYGHGYKIIRKDDEKMIADAIYHGEPESEINKEEFIVLSRIDMLVLREDKPVTIWIDGRPFTLCTDEYFEKTKEE